MHRWSPIPLRWSVGGLSLVRLLVTRLLVLLLESWSVFRRWSICSSLIGPSTAVVVTGLTAGRLARSSLVHPFGSCHSCVCSSRGRSSVCSGRGHWLARPSGSLLLVCRCTAVHTLRYTAVKLYKRLSTYRSGLQKPCLYVFFVCNGCFIQAGLIWSALRMLLSGCGDIISSCSHYRQ